MAKAASVQRLKKEVTVSLGEIEGLGSVLSLQAWLIQGPGTSREAE